MKVGEERLFPAVRRAAPEVVIAANEPVVGIKFTMELSEKAITPLPY